MKKAIAICLLLCGAIWLGWTTRDMQPVEVIAKQEVRLLSPVELQQELVRRGHNLTVDGIIGPITVNAWQAECDKRYVAACAARAMGDWNND